MSEYPATPSYGANYGSRDHPNPPYLPPTFPNQYLQPDDGRAAQGHMASNYDTSMSAYAYNRALPAFSAAAVASGVPPLPIYQGWNQEAIPLPAFNPPHDTAQYQNYGNSSHNVSQYYPSAGHQSYPHAQSAKPYEQRELSEGEFEDGGVATNTPPVGFGPSQYSRNGITSYNDNTQHAEYSRAQGFNPQQSYPANDYQYPQNPSAQLRRQQSDSYSPYVSPAVADREDQYTADKHSNTPTSNFVQQPATSITQSHYKPPPNGAIAAVQSSSQNNGYSNPQKRQYNSEPEVSPGHSTPNPVPSVANGKTVAESRKKAQAAILNLLPCDVRYQTYIDEGFREDIIGRLFDDLKIPRNSTKSSNTTPSQTALTSTQASKNQISNEQRPATFKDVNIAGAQLVSVGRKEVQNLAAPSSSGTTIQQSAQSTPSAPKSAAMTEKEKTLQSKMEALRKSREERAQKQAAAKDIAKPVEKSVAVPTPAAHSEPPKVISTTTTKVTGSPSALPSAPKVQPQISNDPIPLKSPAQIPVPQLRQQPSIPGLFLASNSAIPGLQLSSSSTPVPSVSSTPRKRPVAADFDDTVSSMIPFKRPFGHHRNDQPLVINVSDDDGDSEDEDVAMDLESGGDQDSPMQPERKTSGHQSTVLQGSAPPSDKVNKPFTPPPFSSANNTPPLPTNPAKAAYGVPGDLQRKQFEIEELKRKIAEKEAKKRAKQTPSRARTPRMPDFDGSEAKDAATTNGNLASKVEASIKMQQMVTIAQGQVNSDQQRLVDAQAAEAEKLAELQKNELEQKRLLREKNATDQSLVDAEVQQTRTKLEALRAAMAEAEAAYQKSLAEKQRLKEEAERLEEEADLQEKKDRLQNLTAQKILANDNRPSSSSQATETPHKSAPSLTPDRPSGSFFEEPQQIIDGAPNTMPTANSGAPHSETNQVHNLPNGIHVSPDIQVSHKLPADAQNREEVPNSTSTNQALEAALQEAVRAEAELHSHEDEDEMDVAMDMDMEVSYAPDPSHLAPESSSSIALENDGSPEYSPVLDRTMRDVPDREIDDYEPPEAIAPAEIPATDSPPFSPAPPEAAMVDAEVPVAYSPPFSPAPPESILEHKASEPADVPPWSPAPPQPISKPKANESMDINSTQASSEKAQNGTGELLPSVIGSSPKLVERGLKDISKTPLYTPYESPLKRFRAYRFHPEFSHSVSGGLRSKTYNDAVLTALGSPEEFTGEQRDKFCTGLKEVLMDLRVRKIRDFDVIASEIVAHRAKFLGDKSKILALAGTTI
ncbi:hypothetical protein EG329_000198 [Mollisiaceae sp. DMI_Dod_QoI]|nr:hypothetical protein EG329_000198 [Helotiales sp. DMI_Dod_QoI]